MRTGPDELEVAHVYGKEIDHCFQNRETKLSITGGRHLMPGPILDATFLKKLERLSLATRRPLTLPALMA